MGVTVGGGWLNPNGSHCRQIHPGKPVSIPRLLDSALRLTAVALDGGRDDGTGLGMFGVNWIEAGMQAQYKDIRTLHARTYLSVCNIYIYILYIII